MTHYNITYHMYQSGLYVCRVICDMLLVILDDTVDFVIDTKTCLLER